MTRSRAWEIAADLETAANAVRIAARALDSIHESALPEVEAIPGTQMIDVNVARCLQALSDKYQAIADAEPDDRSEQELRTGFREEDFA